MRRGAISPKDFNKHRRPTGFVGYFTQRSQLLFSPKRKATSAYNVKNKKHIMQMERLTGFQLCLVMQMLYFSQFFTFLRICSHSNVHLFISCKLCD